MTRYILPILLVLPACLIHVDESTDHDVVQIEGDVDAIVVQMDAGDLTVRVADVTEVEVRRNFTWSGDEPDVAAYLDQGTLYIEVDCAKGLVQRCSVDHEVLLPMGATVAGEVGAGDVWIEHTQSGVDLETGAGDIQIIGTKGRVWLTTGAGDVTGEQIMSDEVYVDTGAGDASLHFDAVPRIVEVDSGAGDVYLGVPKGSYRLELETGVGEVSVNGLTTDNSSANLLHVETGVGDITCEGHAPIE